MFVETERPGRADAAAATVATAMRRAPKRGGAGRPPLRVMDLFSGCGGMTCGLSQAGFEVVAAFDAWRHAVDAYKLNKATLERTRGSGGWEPRHADLSLAARDPPWLAWARELAPDMIAGGPPCQDFSQAGDRKDRRSTEGRRARLTVDFATIVAEVRPRAFAMENVPLARNKRSYREAREIFAQAGYGLTELVVDASRCGAPQRRRRLVLVGVLGAEDGFLAKPVAALLSDRQVGVGEYLRAAGAEPGFRLFYVHPHNYAKKAVFGVERPAPTIRGTLRSMPRDYRELHWAPGNDGAPADHVHSLTLEEYALIQTFPASYAFDPDPERPDLQLPQTKHERALMIGNAVPPAVAERVGRALLGYLGERREADAEARKQAFRDHLAGGRHAHSAGYLDNFAKGAGSFDMRWGIERLVPGRAVEGAAAAFHAPAFRRLGRRNRRQLLDGTLRLAAWLDGVPEDEARRRLKAHLPPAAGETPDEVAAALRQAEIPGVTKPAPGREPPDIPPEDDADGGGNGPEPAEAEAA
jgi:DNA (cytosine-5)-methyltransferase 1